MATSHLISAPRRSQRLALRLASATSISKPDIKFGTFGRDIAALAVRKAYNGASSGSMHCAVSKSQQDCLVATELGRTRKRRIASTGADENLRNLVQARTDETIQADRRSERVASKELPAAMEGSSLNTSAIITEKVVLRKTRAKSTKHAPTREFEARLWQQGFRRVVGVDEAGRGPLAGPVVAAACIIPDDVVIEGIFDSKMLREEERERLFEIIISTPGVSYAVHVVEAGIIDQINILQATMQAMSGSIKQLCSMGSEKHPDYVLVDGNRLPSDLPPIKAEFIIKGDMECHVIAAASILAKVTRDRLMIKYDEKWPQYGFKAHKGYGTAAHIAALLKCGPCDIHRRSFAPIKDWHQFGP